VATTFHTNEQSATSVDQLPNPRTLPEIRIYSHSALFYWWPIWVVGFVIAGLTALQGEIVVISDQEYWVHPSRYLGVAYAAVMLLVILLSNISMRGVTSLAVILAVALVAVTLAYMQWLDDVVALIPYVGIYMNLGFYLFLATGVFILWAMAFFVFDRMEFWRVRPGQMTFERWLGDAEKSYDTRGMVFEKHLEDYFKHFLLGFGMGDLRISTSGARSEDIYISNVFLVDRKVRQIQQLIAVKPDDLLKSNGHNGQR
jgi:hypothetical protein